jgi:hypothetical protein
VWQVDKILEPFDPLDPGFGLYRQIPEGHTPIDGGDPSAFSVDVVLPLLTEGQDNSIHGEFPNNTKRRASVTEDQMGGHKRIRYETESSDQADYLSTPPPSYSEAFFPEGWSLSIANPDGPSNLDDDQDGPSLPGCEPESFSFIEPTVPLPVNRRPSVNDAPRIGVSMGIYDEGQILCRTRPDIDPLRILPTLRYLGLSWTTEETDHFITDLGCTSGSISSGTLPLLDIASSFFEAHPTNQDLFPLFFLISTVYRGRKGYFHRLVACIYSTNTASDMKLLEEHLLEAISETEGCESTIFDQFLLQVALIMLYKKLDMDDCCRERIGKATSIFHGIDTFLGCQKSYPESTRLDISSYSMLYLAFGFLGVGDSRQSINDAHRWGLLLHETLEQAVDHHLKLLEDAFLCQILGPCELVGESLQNPCLRNCLQWCKTRLSAAYRLPPTLQALRR